MVLEKILREDLEKSVITNGFRVCGLYPFSPDSVDFSKCVMDHDHLNETHNSVPASDIRHDHLEILLGAELVSKFKSGAGEEDSLAYTMWAKSKEICFGDSPSLAEKGVLQADVAGPSENGIQDENAAGPSCVPSENGIPDADVAGPSHVSSRDTLAKVLSPETGGAGVPSPIKRAFHWPGTPKKSKKNVRRCLESGFPAISSVAFRNYKFGEKKKKIEKERVKEENKLKREEMKKKKEILKREALKKTEKRPRHESETSNSDADVTSGKSNWNEEETSDDEETPKWQPVIRQEGASVVVKYEGKYFPGEILEVKETGAWVKSMKPSGRLWIWPDKLDRFFYEWKDVVSHCDPTKTSKTRNVFAVKELDFQSQFV